MVTAARTISQVAMHMAVSFGVLYVLTGSFVADGAAAVLEPLCNVILMPFHDRFWERVKQKAEARGRQTAVAADTAQTVAMQA
jgi:uncharacterized membrane protein